MFLLFNNYLFMIFNNRRCISMRCPQLSNYFFLLNCCVFSTILLNYSKERNPFKHLYNNLLMKSKLLLSFFTVPDSSSIKLKWLAEFLHYVLHLHFRCSDFCSQTILLKSLLHLYLHCLFLSLSFSRQIESFCFLKVFSTLSASPLQGQKFYSSS